MKLEAEDPPPRRRGWVRLGELMLAARTSEFNAVMTARGDASGNASLMGPLGRSMLYALVRQYRPRIVVETGGNLGMSSAFILKAQQDAAIDGARLYSIERSRKFVAGSLIPEDLKAGYVPLAGEVEEFLAGDRLPPEIDMFLHDSTHRYNHMTMEFKAFWPRLRRGGLLVSHDVDMNAAFTDFVSRTYEHDEGGIALRDRTGHLFWGCFAELGFVVKR